MNREELIAFLDKALKPESNCTCHSITWQRYDTIRTLWSSVFTALHPDGSETDSESRERINWDFVEETMTELLHSILTSKDEHMKLRGILNHKKVMLERGDNPPPQYVPASDDGASDEISIHEGTEAAIEE